MEQEIRLKIALIDKEPFLGCTVSAWNTMTGKQKEQMIQETILENVDCYLINESGELIEE